MTMLALTSNVFAQYSDTVIAPKYKTWKQAKATFNLEKAKLDFDLAHWDRTQEYYYEKCGSKKGLIGCYGNDSKLQLDIRKRCYSELFYSGHHVSYNNSYTFSSKTGNLELFSMELENDHGVYLEYYYYDDNKNLTFYVIYQGLYDEKGNPYRRTMDIISSDDPNLVIRYEIVKDVKNHYLRYDYNAQKNIYKVWRIYFNDEGYWLKIKGKIKALVTGDEDFIQITKLSYKEWKEMKNEYKH